jgi:hypothetical protein
MSKVGQIEGATQNRIVKLFQEVLQYRYLGNFEKEDKNVLKSANPDSDYNHPKIIKS